MSFRRQGRIDRRYRDPLAAEGRRSVHYADLTDSSSLVGFLDRIKPDEARAASGIVETRMAEFRAVAELGLVPFVCPRLDLEAGDVAADAVKTPVLPGVHARSAAATILQMRPWSMRKSLPFVRRNAGRVQLWPRLRAWTLTRVPVRLANVALRAPLGAAARGVVDAGARNLRDAARRGSSVPAGGSALADLSRPA